MRVYQSMALLAATTSYVVAEAGETNATSASELVPMLDSVVAQLCGVDIIGHNVKNYKATNPDGCIIPCYLLSNYESNAASWSNYEGGTCWCKKVPDNGWAFLLPKTGAISLVDGRKLPYGVELIRLWEDYDIPGNDIGNAPAKDVNACSSACMRWNRCFAFTWTNYYGGTCWMKSKGGDRVRSVDAVAGYVARQFIKRACST